MQSLRVFAVMVGLWVVPNLGAAHFSNHLDDGGWLAASSVFECALVHSVPYYGDAVFKTRAGESSSFVLRADTSRFKTGQAALVAKSPVWHEQPRSIDLGYIPVKQGLEPIQLESLQTERLLAELYNGLEIQVTRAPWYGGDESTRLAINTIGFRGAYQQYLSCLSDLLPVNFEQIQRTAVYFATNQHEDIAARELKKLDHIALYVKADPTVKEFYIDGHTDSVGMRVDNLELAKQRAEEVTRHLINRGVPEDAIVSRWHGERYPIAGNATVEERAKNRRVTIRLERIKPPLSSAM